jgi:hypothetical protein
MRNRCSYDVGPLTSILTSTAVRPVSLGLLAARLLDLKANDRLVN